MIVLEHLIAIWYYVMVLTMLVLNSDMAWHNKKRSAAACYAIHFGISYAAVTWYGPIMRALKW